MTVKFTLPIKPFSINQMFCRDMRYKSQAYQIWATEVLAYLREADEYKSLMELSMAHKEVGGTFYVSFIYNYPAYIFYNKQGQVSAKTIDLTNGGKPLLDLIFGDTMDINDRFVTGFKEEKRASASYTIDIIICLNS